MFMYVSIFYMCVCFPSVVTPHLSGLISKSGSLINTYLCFYSEAIYICGSAQRLNIYHQAKSNCQLKKQKVFHVCIRIFWTLNNNLCMTAGILLLFFCSYLTTLAFPSDADADSNIEQHRRNKILMRLLNQKSAIEVFHIGY